jgi:ubiquinone/menaquinone biosynthesis C-methylase UbiE
VSFYSKLFAQAYDSLTHDIEQNMFSPVRKSLVADVEEPALEIGSGTGANVPFFPDIGSENRPKRVFLERSPWMMKKFLRKGFGTKGYPLIASGSYLPFRAGSFRTVIATLVLCSIQEVDEPLSEIVRVLKPGGIFLSFEHVASQNFWMRGFQGLLTPVWKHLAEGCHLNRETDRAIGRLLTLKRGGTITHFGTPFVWGVYQKEEP